MSTRLYIKGNTKFFCLSTSQLRFHLNLVYVFHQTLNGDYVLQALRRCVSFSPRALRDVSRFFSEAGSAGRKCVECVRGHTVCPALPGCKGCTIVFACSQICITGYSIGYRTVALYFLLFKNIWGKDFSVYNFIFILISILFKTHVSS